eukprot:914029-Amphidinium_carterae.1
MDLLVKAHAHLQAFYQRCNETPEVVDSTRFRADKKPEQYKNMIFQEMLTPKVLPLQVLSAGGLTKSYFAARGSVHFHPLRNAEL